MSTAWRLNFAGRQFFGMLVVCFSIHMMAVKYQAAHFTSAEGTDLSGLVDTACMCTQLNPHQQQSDQRVEPK